MSVHNFAYDINRFVHSFVQDMIKLQDKYCTRVKNAGNINCKYQDIGCKRLSFNSDDNDVPFTL